MLGRFITQLAEAAGSVVGVRSGTEEPHYTVEQTLGALQIRRYGARIAAQTTIEGDRDASLRNGFRRLASYIFGGNRNSAKIAMTAPVSQQSADSPGQKIAMTAPVSQQSGPDGTWVIRFFMPSQATMDSLPEPNDQTVELVTVPAQTLAVLRFGGIPRASEVASRTDELLHALQHTTFEPAGNPVAWFYDPPWTIPFRRRNEIAIPVAAR